VIHISTLYLATFCLLLSCQVYFYWILLTYLF